MSKKKFAHEVVPAPEMSDYCVPNASADGYAARAAAYHAARAQGFYLASLEGARMDVIANLCNEFHLASLYHALATTDINDIDNVGVDIRLTLEFEPDQVGVQIWEILSWANVDPEAIAAYEVKAA